MSGNSFKVGDEVRLKKLKQDGKVLEVTSKGTFKVAVGALTIELKGSELEPASANRHADLLKKLKPKVLPIQGEIIHEKMPEILDLHGLRVEEALPKVAHFLDQAILQDKDLALILHGLGTGRLLEAVHGFLKKTPTVKRFELDQTNPGITRVYF
jgi:DNA mismatch repair protein MutS2